MWSLSQMRGLSVRQSWLKVMLPSYVCVCPSVGKVPLDTALELSLYLSREMETLAVTQGLSELVPIYKLMEKRDMKTLEDQMKVRLTPTAYKPPHMSPKSSYSYCLL